MPDYYEQAQEHYQLAHDIASKPHQLARELVLGNDQVIELGKLHVQLAVAAIAMTGVDFE